MPNTSTTQLRAWIERCRNGDLNARNELLAHIYDRLIKLASKRLHGNYAAVDDRVETVDVVQELYLKIVEKWDTFIQPKTEQDAELDAVALFFRRSARFIGDILCENMRKRFGRDGSRPQVRSLDGFVAPGQSSQAGFDPGSNTHNPEKLAFWTEFHECIQSLPNEQREVVELHWFQDLTHAEVGEVLGIAESTSRQRWTRARVQLKSRFPDTPFDWGA